MQDFPDADSASFSENIVTENRGDVAQIPIELQGGEQGSPVTLQVGSLGDDNYVTNVTLVDEDGDGEIVLEWEDLHGADPSDGAAFLSARARVKGRRFPAFVEQAVADGYLAAPRGTTEYGNDNHRCPACGSSDVNWVADGTYCLRCSTPMDAD